METVTYDIIVIGGGRASNLAIAAAKNGLKTLLIEKDKLGGTCPNRGCVPSKLLIGFSEAAHAVRDADRHFIDATLNQIDLNKLFSSVNEYIGKIDARYESRLTDAGVELVRGEAHFTGIKTVEANNLSYTAERIVIGTGSRPNPIPRSFAHLPVWNSDRLFPLLDRPPKRLLIVGGGFIACEMGAFFSGIGVETTLLARSGRLLSQEDVEIEKVFLEEFSKHLNVLRHAELKSLKLDDHVYTAEVDVDGKLQTLRSEQVLFAIGRRPNTDSLNLEKTGIQVDARGFVPVDDNLETTVPGIYACGDVNGRYMLQHAASYEVKYLRDRLLKGMEQPINESQIAHAVYTHPEIASVGLTEEQARGKKIPYATVCENWLPSARAMATRLEYPRIKLIVSTEDYSILGCHLIGPDASTLIHQVMTVMQLDNDVRRIPELIHIHPALNECILAAAVRVIEKVHKQADSS